MEIERQIRSEADRAKSSLRIWHLRLPACTLCAVIPLRNGWTGTNVNPRMSLNRRYFVGALFAASMQAARRPVDVLAVEERVFGAVNRERRSRGLAALAWNDSLAAEARRHSERMQRHRFFSHDDPDRGGLGNRLRAAGIRYQASAENLYRQSGPADPASAAVAAWLRSRGHRMNLLGRAYRETGVGVAVDSAGRYTITQIFLA